MSYREERRADRAAEREQDRQDKKLLIEGQLEAKRVAAEERRRDEEHRRRQAQQEKKAKERARAERRARRAAKYGRAFGWLAAHPVDLFVGFVMAASVIPAVISQVGALGSAKVHFLLAALLAAMLEGGAWALTFMGKAAEDAGRETRKYRIATWATASLAAGINFWHWAEVGSPLWVASVFGASSLFAIYVWDMRTHGSHGPTRAERREERERRRHVKRRRKDHKDEYALAERLMSAAPYGSLDEEAAFATAWRIRHGAEPGMTAALYAQSVDARLELGNVLQSADTMSAKLLPTAVLTALHNPFPKIAQQSAPTLPRVRLQGGGKGATTQAGIGLYGSQGALEKGRGNNRRAGAGDSSGGGVETRRKGRSEEELKALLPTAHTAASELVAEGRRISAAALARRLQVRREDGMWLRDRVIEERKLRVVDGGDETVAKGA